MKEWVNMLALYNMSVLYAIPYIILLLCVVILIYSYHVESFVKPAGIIFTLITISVAVLRYLTIPLYQTRLYWPSTLLTSGLVVGFATFLFLKIMEKIVRRAKVRHSETYMLRLEFGYLLFGILQQIFFQVVFLETILFVLDGRVLYSLIITLIFYFLFHLRKLIRKYILIITLFGMFSILTYYLWGNVLWIGIAHGILGSVLYHHHISTNQIKRRLG